MLSRHVVQWLGLAHLATEQAASEDELPKLSRPIGIGSALAFNSMVYYHIKRPEAALPKTVLEAKTRNSDIISKNIKDNKGHYLKFVVDPNGIIESVSYLGSEEVVVPSLSAFIGLSVAYLNKVTPRNDAGLITDLAEFLSQNWAICLYHELFTEFRQYVKKMLMAIPVA